MAEEGVKSSTEMTQPVIIDLGKQRASTLKELKKGEGKLWDEIFDVVDEVKEMLGDEANGKVLIPIVMLYKEKSRSRRIDLNRIVFPLLDYDDDEDDDDYDDEDI